MSWCEKKTSASWINPEPWNYDDGSWHPSLLRPAWHAAATWDPDPPLGEPRGGSQGGASMRFEPEASYEEPWTGSPTWLSRALFVG